MNINKYISKAKQSKSGLWLLNFILGVGIPFNKPHRIKVFNISNYSVTTKIPYIRKNFNHIKGIHACALATCSEFSSGLLLLSNLDIKKYRLIMEKIEMTYHYQAKSACFAKIELSDTWFKNNIFIPLETMEKTSITTTVTTYDINNNHICSAKISWQLKNWTAVKTKL